MVCHFKILGEGIVAMLRSNNESVTDASMPMEVLG